MTSPEHSTDGAMTIRHLFHDAFFAKDLPSAARALESCALDDIVEIMAHMRSAHIGTLLLHFPAFLTRRLLTSLPAHRVIEAILELPPADAAVLLRHLDQKTRQEIIELAPQPIANSILERLNWPDGSAGHCLEEHSVTCYEDQTIHDAVEQIERLPNARRSEIILLTRDQRVRGTISIQDLLGKDRGTPLSSLPIHTIPILRATDDQEAVGQAFEIGHATSLPVVDHQERFMGAVPFARMFKAWKVSLMAPWLTILGISESDSQELSIGSALKRRLPWTGLNLVVALLVTWILAAVHPPTESIDPLTVVPLILLTSLSLGLQSLGTTMRALMFAAPTIALLRTHGFNEIRITAAQGGILAISLAMIMLLCGQPVSVTWPVSAAVWLTGIVSCVAGVILPWVSTRHTVISFQISSILFVAITLVTGILSYSALGTS